MKRQGWIWAVGLVAVVGLGGCAHRAAMVEAREAFARAQGAGAEAKAPYEYYAAEAYLQLAEHEDDEGDSRQVKAFAVKSRAHSEEALRKVGGGS